MSNHETDWNPKYIYRGQSSGIIYLMISRRKPGFAIWFTHYQRKNSRIVYMCFHCHFKEYHFLRNGLRILQFNDDKGFIFFNPELWERALLYNIAAFAGDGSFKAGVTEYGPKTQLYTLHMIHNDSAFPMLIAMLSSKTKATYERMFLTLFNTLSPQALDKLRCIPWIFDFESATILALQDALPGVQEIRGCAFHFAQSLNRKITSLFANNKDSSRMVQQWINQCRACVFLPLYVVKHYKLFQVPASFLSLQPDVLEACREFSSYLIETYQCGPVFSKIWSQYGNLRHRTSNFAESYHRGLRNVFDQRAPTLNLALKSTYRYLDRARIDIENLAKGLDVPNNMKRGRRNKLDIIAGKMHSFKVLVESSPNMISYNAVLNHLQEMIVHIPTNTK